MPYKLVGTPGALPRRKGVRVPGNTTHLLCSVSQVCGHTCPFCWTEAGSSLANVDEQRLTPKDIEDIISAFHAQGGRAVAIMSDGEPLLKPNLGHVKTIAKITGEKSLFFVLFTNGELLNEAMIRDLSALNPSITFVVSINAATEALYDSIHGKGHYNNVMRNRSFWKAFIKRTNRRVKGVTRTQFAVHFVVTTDTKGEVDAVAAIAKGLDCAFIAASPGMSGRATRNRKRVVENRAVLNNLEEIAKSHSLTRGPTARSADGQCGYIIHSHNTGLLSGWTLDLVTGMPRACPYFVGRGCDWMRYPGGCADVATWFQMATTTMTMLTDAIHAKFGFYYCLMRHYELPNILPFVAEVNRRMEALAAERRDVTDKLIVALYDVLAELVFGGSDDMD